MHEEDEWMTEIEGRREAFKEVEERLSKMEPTKIEEQCDRESDTNGHYLPFPAKYKAFPLSEDLLVG